MVNPETGGSPNPRASSIFLGLALAATLICSWRLGRMIQEKAVNVLFWDQWDFYRPLFQGAGLWELFTHQHGPHRQGLGNWVIAGTSALSRWDSAVDSWVILGALVLATLGMIALRRLLTGHCGPSDILYPVLILNTIQYHIFIATPNIAHGALPLLLTVTFAWTWQIPGDRLRESLQAVLLFLAMFTGFAFILVLVAPALWAVYFLRTWDGRPRRGWILLGGIITSILAFLPGYRWGETAGLPTSIDNPTPGQVYHFYTNLLARFSGYHPFDAAGLRVIGTLVLISSIAAVAFVLWRSRPRGDSPRACGPDLAVLTLLATGLATAASITYGRIEGGLLPSLASRYVPLVMPVLIGIVLAGQLLLPRRTGAAILAVFLAFCVWRAAPLYPWQERDMGMLYTWKSTWKSAYLQTGSITTANQMAGRPIYPNPDRVQLEDKLRFLKENRLNLFKNIQAPPPQDPGSK